MPDKFELEAEMDAPLTSVRKKRREPTPSGHAGIPGTGPEGETCGSCRHLFRNQRAKTYLKCELNKTRWTGGRKSDVRARDKSCKFWEKPTETPK